MQIKMGKVKIILAVLAVQALALLTISMVDFSPSSNEDENTLVTSVLRRSYPIDIRSVGELEAAKSISISSTLRSDQPKIIQLVADGTNVNAGDLLVKIDPTPFEDKVEELNGRIKEMESQIESLEQALRWEKAQADHELKAVEFELETAELELNKIINGDGPLEISRLKALMQKAKVKYEELNHYADDLVALEAEGYLNPVEVRQTHKKLEEEREAFESSKMQYESYILHVQPMQVKKAETSVRRQMNKFEETTRTGKFKIAKAEASLLQAQQQSEDLERQLRGALIELQLTELTAPSSGMVVLKEEYRQSQKRKPRVGDVIVRNQTLLDLPDLSSMIVKTKIREIDLYKIEVGKPVTIEVDAYPNLVFKGKVTFIGILAMADVFKAGDEKHFEVKVALNHSDPRLRPGMTSRVTIHAGQVQDALSVPIHAVFENEKKHYCYIARKGVYIKQQVEIGMNNEQWVEILAGLHENDHICLSLPPEKAIVNGEPLQIKPLAQEQPIDKLSIADIETIPYNPKAILNLLSLFEKTRYPDFSLLSETFEKAPNTSFSLSSSKQKPHNTKTI